MLNEFYQILKGQKSNLGAPLYHIVWAQHAAGIGILILEDDGDLLYFKVKWINSIKFFLMHINTSLKLDSILILPQ